MLAYLRIIFWWLFFPALIGLLLAIAGTGRGGASAIFLFIGLFAGAIGAILHSLLRAVRSGNGGELGSVTLISVASVGLLLMLYYQDGKCDMSLSEQQAIEKISSYLLQTGRSVEYLGAPDYQEDQCHYAFAYTKRGERMDMIVRSTGRVGSMPVEEP